MTPAQRLTKARLAADISAAAVARSIAEARGTSARAAAVTLARWESGERTPDAESLLLWATALGVPVPTESPLAPLYDVVLRAADLVEGLADTDVPEAKRAALRRLREVVERMEG